MGQTTFQNLKMFKMKLRFQKSSKKLTTFKLKSRHVSFVRIEINFKKKYSEDTYFVYEKSIYISCPYFSIQSSNKRSLEKSNKDQKDL